MILPSDKKALTKLALDLIEICRVSQGQRAAAYRSYGQWIETGYANGGLAIANLLGCHIDRLQSHLFSPTEMQFTIDYELARSKEDWKKAEVGGKLLSREWERRNIDINFAEGVKVGLQYGAGIQKNLVNVTQASDGTILKIDHGARTVMPWQFGVYNEGDNDLSSQEAICETVYITRPEAWRRVANLPEAETLFKRIVANSSKNQNESPLSTSHPVLSTAILDVSLTSATNPSPGGIVQLANNPSFSQLGPQVAAELIPMHELWVWDDTLADHVTIQIIEPDILVCPRYKNINLYAPDTLPYTLIQPNVVPGYFWGRSEIADLMMLQQLLGSTLDDFKRLMGVQFDKILAFPGYEGMTDEVYGQFRTGGYLSMPPGSSVTDLTPQIPQATLQYISMIEGLFDKIAGFSNILSGQGEPGVRAGNQAELMLRTASPRLRDRAMLVERSAASAGDKTFACMQAKDPRAYWMDPDEGAQSEFLLEQIPDDRRVSVDSHSSSPIYHDDHQQLVAFGVKAGFIDGESAIDLLPYPQKEMLKMRLRAAKEAQLAFAAAHPEVLSDKKKK